MFISTSSTLLVLATKAAELVVLVVVVAVVIVAVGNFSSSCTAQILPFWSIDHFPHHILRAPN